MKPFLKAFGQYLFFAEREFFLIAGPSAAMKKTIYSL